MTLDPDCLHFTNVGSYLYLKAFISVNSVEIPILTDFNKILIT